MNIEVFKTDRFSITMPDFINLIKKYVDLGKSVTIVDAGSLI